MSASSDSQTDPAAVKPRCRHFGVCGGCRLQDVAYEAQLERKVEVLKELLQRLEWAMPIPMHPSPEQWYYRNKMEFSFQDVYPRPPEGEDYLLLGQKVRNRWDRVLNVAECHLLSPETPKLLGSVRSWAIAERLEPYNLHKKAGFLRHLVVREGKNTGERLVNLVTTEGEIPKESFVKAVLSSYPATTVLRAVHSGKADVAVGESNEVLHGPGHIHEEFLGKRFRVSPYSFTQTNTRGAEFLYTLIRAWLEGDRHANVLDLYCGGGGIALSVADLCERVMGIEALAPAVEDGRRNAAENKITNVEFAAAKVEDLLPGLAAQKVDVDVAIADPPRSGMHPKVRKALADLAPARILYVSCNPKAMVEDVKRLSELYDVRKIEVIDLFPHTDHMEVVALLQRIY